MKRWRRLKLIFYFVFAAILLGAGFTTYIYVTTPDAAQIKGCLTANMHQIRLCPSSGNYVKLQDISQDLLNAVIISEDAAFYHHSGFDFSEIQASFERNWQEFRLTRGASTITQQLAKNVFLSGHKAVTRKLREAILAVQIEEILTKDQILERYLNVVEFGPNLFGIGAAARYYFQKHPKSLNILESSYLTHLLPNPQSYAVGFHKGKLSEFNRRRVLTILRKLFLFKKITESQYVVAQRSVDDFPWTHLDPQTTAVLKGADIYPFDGNSLNLDETLQDKAIQVDDSEGHEDSLPDASTQDDNLGDSVPDDLSNSPDEDPPLEATPEERAIETQGSDESDQQSFEVSDPDAPELQDELVNEATSESGHSPISD